MEKIWHMGRKKLPDKQENFKDILLQGLTEVRSTGIAQQAQAAGPLSLPTTSHAQVTAATWWELPLAFLYRISYYSQTNKQIPLEIHDSKKTE